MIQSLSRPCSAALAVIALGLAAVSCGTPGPLETKLDLLAVKYEEMRAAGKPDRKAAVGMLRELAPLLSEKNYAHEADIKKQRDIMYRASLLLVRIAYGAGLEQASRTFYMNAYLLRGKQAFTDIGRGLPSDADLTVFGKIHVPQYTLSNRRSGRLDFSADKFKDLDPKTRARTRTVNVNAEIKEVPAYYLLQMLCGHVLHKLKAEHPDLGSLRVKISSRGKPAAVGTWNFASDELVLRLPHDR